MNIKEIIDAERWEISGGIDDEVIQLRHNVSLARIEDAVLKRIAELEAQLPKAVTPKRWVSRLGDDMFECPACHRKVKGNLYSHKACQCGAKLE